MTKICKRCGNERKKTSFRKLKCRNGERSDVCRKCYDTNQLEKFVRSPEQIQSQRQKLTGRKYSVEHRLAISDGQKNAVEEGRHHWKKNDVRHKDQDRCQIRYKIWREQVLSLKNNKCEICGKTNHLHIHHLKCFYKFPELKFDVLNGQVLCRSCHMRVHRTNKLP